MENTDKKAKNEDDKVKNKKLQNDYQLSEAINLLKGLNILSFKKN